MGKISCVKASMGSLCTTSLKSDTKKTDKPGFGVRRCMHEHGGRGPVIDHNHSLGTVKTQDSWDGGRSLEQTSNM